MFVIEMVEEVVDLDLREQAVVARQLSTSRPPTHLISATVACPEAW